MRLVNPIERPLSAKEVPTASTTTGAPSVGISPASSIWGCSAGQSSTAGSVVSVYRSVDPERMRRETLVGVYVWAGEAASLIEDATLRKQNRLDKTPTESVQRCLRRVRGLTAAPA